MTEALDTTTGELVPIERDSGPGHGSLGMLGEAIRLADVIADTEMVPAALRGRPAAVVAVVLAGHELGLGPMQSLAQVHLINGRPSLAAEAMRGLAMAHGHTIIPDANEDAATVRCRRRDWPPDQWAKFVFTMGDAERAGLAGHGVWKQYPRAMLTARATAEACRAIFPDVLAGLSYTPEEAGGVIDIPADEDDASWSGGHDSTDPAPAKKAPPIAPGESFPAAVVELVAEVESLDPEQRNAIGVYMAAQRIPWPPDTATQARRIQRWLEANERESR
jgi:hypothetical protein